MLGATLKMLNESVFCSLTEERKYDTLNKLEKEKIGEKQPLLLLIIKTYFYF